MSIEAQEGFNFNMYDQNTYFAYTVDGFIFVGTNFRGFNVNDTFVGLEIRGHRFFLHNPYRK